MSRNRKFFLIVLQLAMWSAFVALPYFMIPRFNDANLADAFVKHHYAQPDQALNVFLSSLVFNFFLIVFFYAHHYILFDRFVVTRRFGEYACILVASFIFIFMVSHYFKRYFFADIPGIFRPVNFREIVRAGTWYSLVLLVSMGVKLLVQLRQAEQRAREIENAQLRTELSFLHAQINPHFLFNSLNTIYSLALKKSDTAPVAVLKLSQLLRYVIDDANRDKVPMEQEVNYLNNYIELQKLRSTSSLLVSFRVEGDIATLLISPLLLLPFVENAFKYGISSNQVSPIDILLSRQGDSMTFTVKNKKFEQGETDSTGIGINNVRRRLDLLYPDKYKLEIADGADSYFIKLIIQFT
jgi:two-component system LytT family sensor kinase